MRSIDPVCDAFEAAWQQGTRPVIEDYLGTVVEAVQPLLLAELVRTELEWRFRRGDLPTAAEYRARLPACTDSIENWLTEARRAAETLSADGEPDTIDPGMPITAHGDRAKPAAAKPSPRVLGAYELLGPLGAGGMGEVYKARHKRLDKLVALKVLPPLVQHSAERVARFLREMKAVGSLDHPNVVEAHDAGEQSGVVYLVMKLIDGTALAKFVKEHGPLPVAEACQLARQTALGLQYLHERGLVHRDLKPSNLMRTPDGTVKILDLGLARWRVEGTAANDLTGTGQIMGTPDYLAPEQIRGTRAVDIRADLYGLGCTLFFLLIGRAPFAHHKSQGDKLDAHRHEPPPDVRTLRPEVPAALADLLRRLLAKKPEDRPQTPAEVAAALGDLERGTTSGTTVSFPPTAGPAKTLPWWPWLAAGMCVALLAVWLVLALVRRDGTIAAAPGKLVVLGLDVTHFENVAGRNDLPRGLLGQKSFATRCDDSVTLEARLSRPAYAFMIAFRPDGKEELCFPESEDEPPPRTDRPRYPSVSRGVNYGLNEGEGLQVFAVVASSRPLPAYKTWRPQRKASPWQKAPASPGVVWWDNGEEVVALTVENPGGQRSKGQEVRGKTPVADLTEWLRQAPEVEAVGTVGFAVLPKSTP